MKKFVKQYGKISLELIDVQKDDFTKECEKILEKIRDLIVIFRDDTHEDIPKLNKELEQLIFHRFGIKNIIVFNNPKAIAATICLQMTEKHVLSKNLKSSVDYLKIQNDFLEYAKNKSGYVNLHEAKVYGIFSEYTNYIFLNYNLLYNYFKFTSKEIISVLLHEIGHLFNYLEYSDRIDNVNQVLCDVSKHIYNTDTKTDLVYVYKELKSINNDVTEEDVDKLLNSNKIIMGLKWFELVGDTVKMQLDNTPINMTLNEVLADAFSARFGMGGHLMTAVYKLDHKGVSLTKNEMVKVSMFAIMGDLLVTASTIALVTIFSLPGVICYFLWKLFFSIQVIKQHKVDNQDPRAFTYPETKTRYRDIRDQTLVILKDKSLPKDFVKEILTTIDQMDEIILSVKSEDINIFDKLVKLVTFENKELKEEDLNKKLAFNELFISANKFKIL